MAQRIQNDPMVNQRVTGFRGPAPSYPIDARQGIDQFFPNVPTSNPSVPNQESQDTNSSGLGALGFGKKANPTKPDNTVSSGINFSSPIFVIGLGVLGFALYRRFA